ncbi:MAG TPA: hypothetical protein VFL57_15680 [Bryobacteraceae bacterium]|nr:hypothetical protein [Bryobacteraceae bacterium]
MRVVVVFVIAWVSLARAERHAAVNDPQLARALKDKYVGLTDGWVKAVQFTPAELDAMKAGRKWEALMTRGPDDPLAKRIQAAGEPSFDAMASHYPGKILDRTLIGTYSDPLRRGTYDDEFWIWWNGAISADLFKGPLTDRLGATGVQPLAHNTNIVFRVGREREMYGAARTRFSGVRYEDGWLPVVVSTYDHEGIRYRQTAFADRPEAESGGWDVAYVSFELVNMSNTAREAVLTEDIVLVDGGLPRAQAGRVVNPAGAVILVHSDSGASFERGRLAHRLRLSPRERRTLAFKIPYVPDSRGLTGAASERDHDDAHIRVRKFWRELLARGAQISVPEERVNAVWRALLVQNFIMADGPRFTYGSGLRYNDSTYPQESNFGAHRFAMYGFKEYAAALQPYFVPMSVTPKGAGRKYQNRRAMVLHHLLENYRLTGGTAVFDRFRADFHRVADEIISDRNSTMSEDRPLHWGLLPPDKPGADVQASTQSAYVLGHNITNCQGLQDFGEFLARSGLDRVNGERYLREAKDFRATLMRAMEQAAIRVPGRPPFIDLQTLYFRATPDYGPEPYDDLALGRLQGAYFHYWVDMLFQYNFFNPDDQVAHWLADYVQQRNGFVLGCTRAARRDWSPYGWINNVYDGGYYNFRLRDGSISEFLLGFYAKLAFGMSRNLYVASEGSPFIGYNTRDGGLVGADYSFPNSAANSDTLFMLRNMLVYEELDANVETGRLMLLAGIPRAWLEDGKRIAASRLATYYGEISFTVESEVRRNRLTATIDPPVSPRMKRILLSIRHPKGAAIRSVRVNGQPHANFDPRSETVRLDAGADKFTVELEY